MFTFDDMNGVVKVGVWFNVYANGCYERHLLSLQRWRFYGAVLESYSCADSGGGHIRISSLFSQLSPKDGSDLLVITRAVLLGRNAHNDK